MKKKLKLNLKKDVISNLQALSIIGGYNTTVTDPTACQTDCDPCVTDSPGCGDPNSDNGCYGNTDATMTCPDYSCTC